MTASAHSHGTRARRHHWVVPGALLLGLAAVYGATLAPSVTWANGGTDSGDLVTAAAVLGIAHPTGYPSYLLLARLFQMLPLGDLAFRTTLLSAVAALAAVLVVYALVRALLGERGLPATLGASVGALALGISPLFWSQAVVAEVLTLNALCVAALLWFALLDAAPAAATALPSGWRLRATAVGLALGNHMTIALMAVVWLAAMTLSASAQGTIGLRGDGWRRIGAMLRRLPWVGLGLLVYVYLPVRAAAHPPISWGDARDATGLLWVITGTAYRELVFAVDANEMRARAVELARLLLAQFGIAGLALGLVGLLADAPGKRRLLNLSLLAATVYTMFALGYAAPDPAVYFLPAFVLIAVWAGVGAGRVLEFIAERTTHWRALPRHLPNASAYGAVGTALAAFLLAVPLLWPVGETYRSVDASEDRRAIAFAEAVLARVPENAVVLTSSDLDTFPLWYAHIALGRRPDIAVVVDPLLEFAWYRAQLRHHEPRLRVPEPETIDALSGFLRANSETSPICRTDPLAAIPVVCDG